MAPLDRYLARGVPVALGTDGGSANGRLSVFDEMRAASLVRRGAAHAGDALTVEDAFHMGTSAGAHATGLPIGRLDPGARADLVALDLGDLSLLPAHRLLANVVYSMQPSAIRHVFVDGEAVVRDRRLVRVREADVAAKVRAASASIVG